MMIPRFRSLSVIAGLVLASVSGSMIFAQNSLDVSTDIENAEIRIKKIIVSPNFQDGNPNATILHNDGAVQIRNLACGDFTTDPLSCIIGVDDTGKLVKKVTAGGTTTSFGDLLKNNSTFKRKDKTQTVYLVKDDGSAADEGKVGINTDDPTTALHINQNGTITNLGRVPLGSSYLSPGLLFQYTSDLGAIGMISRGTQSNDFDMIVGWGDDEDDNLVFRNYRAGNQTVDRMIIRGDGKVGIGMATPTELLEVAGNAKINGIVRANAYYYNSDRRYKTAIKQLSGSLDNLLSLRGYRYYNQLAQQQDIGLIAQEVEQVFPQLVKTDTDGYKSVQYASLVAPIIESIRELSQKVDNLTQILSSVLSHYHAQESRITLLEERIRLLENGQN